MEEQEEDEVKSSRLQKRPNHCGRNPTHCLNTTVRVSEKSSGV